MRIRKVWFGQPQWVQAIFKNENVIELEKSGEGTKITHKEVFGGLLPTLTWVKFEKMVIPMLNSMNERLKKKVEKQHK